MPRGRPKGLKDHLITEGSNSKPLNEERHAINEQEDKVGISNAMLVLNVGEKKASNSVILLNSEESTSYAEK